MDDHEEARARARAAIEQADRTLAESYEREVPAQLHRAPEPERTTPEYPRAPQRQHSGMAPAVQAKWNKWAATIARQELSRIAEGSLADAIGQAIAKAGARRAHELRAEIAQRDARIDKLEARLAALEAEHPAPNISKLLIRGGKADAA